MKREEKGAMDHHFDTPDFAKALAERFDENTCATARLAAQLCTVPGVTVPTDAVDHEALNRICELARGYAESNGLRVYQLPSDADHPYPFLVVSFQEHDLADPDLTEAVALIGHLDVVLASTDDQFSPVLRAADLHARGAADMKTVVATWLVWMAHRQQRSGPKPPFVLLLSCCEENASHAPHHTRSAVRWLHEEMQVTVRFGLVGERTGELEWMGDELRVGPICPENRSWRWFTITSERRAGLEALQWFARTVARYRTTFGRLNADPALREQAARQPGLKSGFLNPFTFIAGDRDVDDAAACAVAGETVRLTVSRPPGGSVHAAVADTAQPSLVERFDDLARQASAAFPGGRVRLAGVAIGQQGNFNAFDGSGEMRLVITGTTVEAVRQWITGHDDTDLTMSADTEAVTPQAGPSIAALDIRELLAHRDAVHDLLTDLQGRLGDDTALTVLNNRPPWRCPGDQIDAARLQQAYAAVIGEASPDLVKVHGNDGGSLVAYQQSLDERLAARGEGHAVVFGQVGNGPHGPREFHRLTSVAPYWEIMDRWAAFYVEL